ncbi:MAG: hypothetical protein LBR16_03785 [Treponema sp.]|jgi:hypothetical protein|nr:hypothetical protein [Treponema sp.]
MKKPARLGKSPQDYARLGLAQDTVAPWEDGTRTGGGLRGTYEWWYFDARFDGGASLVIVFYTKPMSSPGAAPDPHVTLRLVTPEGAEHSRVFRPKRRSDFSAAADHCDVRIGPCVFSDRGGLREYRVFFQDDGITADVTLRSTTRPWRPETGRLFFGADDRDYFAWLAAVPAGRVSAAITINGKTETHSGTGYHDHNWGNVNIRKILHHWYWGRANIGDYTIITSFIWAEKKYGYQTFPIFLIARGPEIIAEDAERVTFSALEEWVEPATGKPTHNVLSYEYDDGNRRLRVTYRREKSILLFPMLNDVHGIIKLLAKLSGFDGAYHRFTGTASLEGIGNQPETTALWELMFLGKEKK